MNVVMICHVFIQKSMVAVSESEVGMLIYVNLLLSEFMLVASNCHVAF